MKSYPSISNAEWLVMKVLWKHSPASADEIVAHLSDRESWKPKTIKTYINRLVKKNAVGFEKKGRRYLYHPLFAENQIVQSKSQNFLNRFFGGALTPMLASMVENKDLSREEVDALKDLLDKALEKKEQGGD